MERIRVYYEDENSQLIEGNLTQKIIGAAIEVHRVLGPGLLESAYEECLCHEFSLRELRFRRQLSLPVKYKGVLLDCGYRLDVLVENKVILEVKCVETLLRVHEAQLLTYMRLMQARVGLILNFHVSLMQQGIVRKVL